MTRGRPHGDITRGDNTAHHDFSGGCGGSAGQINAFPQTGVVVILLGQIKSDSCVVTIFQRRGSGHPGKAVVSAGQRMASDDMHSLAGGQRHRAAVTGIGD